ncbi:hypothetical protein Tco_1368061 [Tanacetum coccineum]
MLLYACYPDFGLLQWLKEIGISNPCLIMDDFLQFYKRKIPKLKIHRLCSLTFLILIPLIAWIEKLLKDRLPLRKLRKPFGMVKVVKLQTNLGVRNLAYLCEMLNEIGQLNIDVNEDTCTWSLGPNGTFTVKDACYRIDQNIPPTLAHATTWDKSIPRKVNVFM